MQETTTWSGRINASSRRAATQKLAKTRRKLLNKDEDDYSGSDSEGELLPLPVLLLPVTVECARV